MSEMLKKGDLYKNFEVLDVFDVPDFHSKAFYLRNIKNGLEIFHMLNDDSENLFSFCFRTLNSTSNGAAHIIEHSVLCGSEKFPLKDPFVSLSNQSVKTYLNAMTYPDKTCFPGSSISKADYFNLMDVYSDAVFFPQLKKEIFLQEAHRLELDDSDEVNIQGVVYNEMKGNYSSFDSVAYDSIAQSLFRKSIYEKDSGGDPLVIPSLTYEDFIKFYKKWYRSDNCLLFLYGNIDTCEQIDFLQEKLLNRLDSKNVSLEISEAQRIKNQDEVFSYLECEELKKNDVFYYEGPSNDSEDDNVVLVSWSLGKAKNTAEKVENLILYGILANHDGTPLNKALLDSKLGEDIAPQTGISAQYNVALTFGLRGVKKGNEHKVEKLILETLEKIAENGVSEKDIDTTLMILEYTQREIKRGNGPYSISIMSSVSSGWCYGFGVKDQMPTSRKEIEHIKEKIKADKSYITDLIKRKLLKNERRALIVVSPTKTFSEKREKAEKKIVSDLLKNTSIDEIKKNCALLHDFQQSEEDSSCLPHLNPNDFIHDGKPEMDREKISVESFENSDGSLNPLFVSEQNTNGIVYLKFGFPVDGLKSEDYKLIPLLCECLTDCGWKNLDWASAAEEIALHAGVFDVYPSSFEGVRAQTENLELGNWIGRDWIIFRLSVIEEELKPALSLLADCIRTVDFSDTKRITDILNEVKNDFESSVVPGGHLFSGNRALSSLSKKNAIEELWNGLSQLYTVQDVARSPVEDVCENFRRVFTQIKKSGMFIHVTAEKKGIENVKSLVPQFVKQIEVNRLLPPLKSREEDFTALTQLDSSNQKNVSSADKALNECNNDEVCVLESQVGYASMTVPGSPYGTKENAVEELCVHWLSNNLLWEKIRTIGGAYGAFCTAESFCSSILFTTYRDPSPLESKKAFEECIHEAAAFDFSDNEVEKAIMGCYSHFVQPKTPKQKGQVALNRLLYGITEEDREKKILEILKTSKEDVSKTFKRIEDMTFSGKYDFKRHSSVICGRKQFEKYSEKEKICGKIVMLPL